MANANTTVRKYTRKIVTRQIMQLRIEKAKNLRVKYNEFIAMRSLDLPEVVKKNLVEGETAIFEQMNKAERKVIASVQKKLAEDFNAATSLFDSFSARWMNDPSHTIVESDSDNDTEESESDEEDLND